MLPMQLEQNRRRKEPVTVGELFRKLDDKPIERPKFRTQFQGNYRNKFQSSAFARSICQSYSVRQKIATKRSRSKRKCSNRSESVSPNNGIEIANFTSPKKHKLQSVSYLTNQYLRTPSRTRILNQKFLAPRPLNSRLIESVALRN